jgi:hypothetical protein
MSDDDGEQTSQTPEPTDPRLQQRRDSLAKARQVHRENLERDREARAAILGIGAGITIEPPDAPRGERGERAEVAREETLGPEVETRRDAREMTLTRRSRLERDVDGIYFPERLKKPGWDYQFVTVRVMNHDQGRVDESELLSWEDQGWRPCLARDYPELAGRGTPGDRPIEMKGSRAYERPKHLSLEAAEEDRIYAEQQRVDRTRAAATGGLGDGIPGDRRGLVRVPDGVRVEGGVWRK